jgi:nucleoside-diphosphate-sugar epimerase
LIAGNGFIGQRTALALAEQGCDVLVHHTGRRATPSHPRIAAIVAPSAPPPITAFPEAALNARADAVIHFMCMGAPDARAFVAAFDGAALRLVLISSCDVYRAYGRFIGAEPGPADATPLDEAAPLRASRYPYRAKAADEMALEYWYDKLDAEAEVAQAQRSETVILRLPKVYGEGRPLDTVYAFAEQPHWRWTHGYVGNLAAAIAAAAFHPKAAGRTFNLGEAVTPTMGERLAGLPGRKAAPAPGSYDFRQDLHFSTDAIRAALDFSDVVAESEAMRAAARQSAN